MEIHLVCHDFFQTAALSPESTRRIIPWDCTLWRLVLHDSHAVVPIISSSSIGHEVTTRRRQKGNLFYFNIALFTSTSPSDRLRQVASVFFGNFVTRGVRFLSCDVAPAGCTLQKSQNESPTLTSPYSCHSGFKPERDQAQRACKKNTPRALMSLSDPDSLQRYSTTTIGEAFWIRVRPL